MTFESLSVALIYLCLPWLLLEAASKVLHRLSSRKGSAVLSLRKSNKQQASQTWISRGPLWVKVETTSLNELPGHLLRRFSRLWGSAAKRDPRPSRSNGHGSGENEDKYPLCEQAKISLELLYDAGTVFAGLALVGSIIFLVWGAFDLIGQISSLGEQELVQPVGLQKRQSEDSSDGQPKAQSWSPTLVPLIPGLTLPMNHIYPLMIALSITQIIHEAGHAICGTLQSCKPLRMGLILLFPCIPGAFVVLPQEAITGDEDEEEEVEDELGRGPRDFEKTSRKRLRNISAGVWHNALTAMILALIIYTGVGRAMHSIVWKEASGMRVESIDPSSPLSQHMPRGSLVSRLNDFDLADTTPFNRSAAERHKAWNSYLLEEGATKDRQLGWCISRLAWDCQTTRCCDVLTHDSADPGAPNSTAEAPQDSICFQALVDPPAPPGRCYNPVRLVSSKSEKQRCSGECSGDDVCIAPDEREQLIRISVIRPDQNSTRVVLFQGSSVSVHSALTVSPYILRLGYISLPYHVFQWWNLLVSYLLNLSLAMALLNMLPLPSLDGDVYLGIVLAALVSRFHRNAHADSNGYEDEEEAIYGMQLGDLSRVTSRPHSPTQLRRPSAPPRPVPIAISQRPSYATIKSQHTSNARVQAKIQDRFRWLTIGLAVFVFGGSIILHTVKQQS